jgi:hypothetical protein
MKPTLTAPRTKRLKLKCDELLSSFAFKFSLRRYTEETGARFHMNNNTGVCTVSGSAAAAGAHIRPLFRSAKAVSDTKAYPKHP